MSKDHIQHSWTKYIICCHHSIRKYVENKLIILQHEMQLTNKAARDLYNVQLKDEKKLGAWFLEKMWQLMWSGKGNKNIVCPMKRKNHINNESSPSIGNSIYFICTLCLNTILSIFIKLLREPLLGQRNFPQKFNKMSQHPSSSSSKPLHTRTPSMEFLDEDLMDVTPLRMIPGDVPGSPSMAGVKQGNTPKKSSDKEDMHFTDRTIRNLVTRILNEEHGVKDMFTPLSRRDPSPEVEPQAEKDDD
jgi:hypothetical protein